MKFKPVKFQIEYKGNNVTIEEIPDKVGSFFRVAFDNGTQLFLTRMKNALGEYSWTSLPAGRQKEADEIGTLIAKYIAENDL